MNIKDIIYSSFWFMLAHIITFFQLNGQFKWDWFRNNELLLALVGVPISFLYIWGTKYAISGFGGMMWPARFIGFGVGMVIYAIGVSFFFNQGISLKVLVSLTLALGLIAIQLFWK
jgi:hypothetical protein